MSPDDADGDGVTVAQGDCDDLDPRVFPGAFEACDGVDNDCDEATDDRHTASVVRGTETLGFPSVAEAIEAALTNGDPVVALCPLGPDPTELDTLQLGDAAVLELYGAAGPDQTVLTSSGFFANVRDGAHLTLRGITLRDVQGSTGLDVRQSTLTLVNSRIQGTNGGAVYLTDQAVAHIESTEILDNDAGALAIGAGLTMNGEAEAMVVDSLFANNRARRGAALQVSRSGMTANIDVTFLRTTIRDNVATDYGGALASQELGAMVTVEACVLTGNQAGDGGAAAIRNGTITFVDSTLEGNTASSRGERCGWIPTVCCRRQGRTGASARPTTSRTTWPCSMGRPSPSR